MHAGCHAVPCRREAHILSVSRSQVGYAFSGTPSAHCLLQLSDRCKVPGELYGQLSFKVDGHLRVVCFVIETMFQIQIP